MMSLKLLRSDDAALTRLKDKETIDLQVNEIRDLTAEITAIKAKLLSNEIELKEARQERKRTSDALLNNIDTNALAMKLVQKDNKHLRSKLEELRTEIEITKRSLVAKSTEHKILFDKFSESETSLINLRKIYNRYRTLCRCLGFVLILVSIANWQVILKYGAIIAGIFLKLMAFLRSFNNVEF